MTKMHMMSFNPLPYNGGHVQSINAQTSIWRSFKRTAIKVTASSMVVAAATFAFAQKSLADIVRFQWNASSGAVAGYALDAGLASGTYDPLLQSDIPGTGTTGSMDLPGIKQGVVYYVAARAYDTLRRYSAFSNEIMCVGDDRGIYQIGRVYPAGMGISPASKVKIFIDQNGVGRIVGQDVNGILGLLRTVTTRAGFKPLGGNIEVAPNGTFTIVSVNKDSTDFWADRYDSYGKLLDSRHFTPLQSVAGNPPEWILFGHDTDNESSACFGMQNTTTGEWREIVWRANGQVDDGMSNAKQLDAIGAGYTPVAFQITSDGARYVVTISGDGKKVHLFQWDGIGVPMGMKSINAPSNTVFNSFAVNRDKSMLRIAYEYAAKNVVIYAYDPVTYATVGSPLGGAPANAYGQFVGLERGMEGTAKRIWFYSNDGHTSTIGISSANTSSGAAVYYYPAETDWLYAGTWRAARFMALDDGANVQMVGSNVVGARIFSRSYPKVAGYAPTAGAGPIVGFNGKAKQFLVSDDKTKLQCWIFNAEGFRSKTDNIGPFHDAGSNPLDWKVVDLDTDENGVTGVLLQNANQSDLYRIVTLDETNTVTRQRDFTLESSDFGSAAKAYRRTNDGRERVVLIRTAEAGGQGRVMRWDSAGKLVNVMTKTPAAAQKFLDYRINYDGSAERFAWQTEDGKTTILNFDVVTGLNASNATHGPFTSGLMPKYLVAGSNQAGGLFCYNPVGNYYRTYNLNGNSLRIGDSVYFQPITTWLLFSSLAKGASVSIPSGINMPSSSSKADNMYAFLLQNEELRQKGIVLENGKDGKGKQHLSLYATNMQRERHSYHNQATRTTLARYGRQHKPRGLCA